MTERELHTEDRSSFESEQNIATAPGDLPLLEVTARFEALSSQFRHDNTIYPLAPRPDEPVAVWATSGLETSVRRAAIYYTTDGRLPDASAATCQMVKDEVSWNLHGGYVTRWRGDIPPQPAETLVRYRIAAWRSESEESVRSAPDAWASDGQGFWFRFQGERGITTFAYQTRAPQPALPRWMQSAVIYHIFLDRFHPGTDDGVFPGPSEPMSRHGGTLAGVRKALPYLAELGVTCLWYSPLGPSETYHRYDTLDYFEVDHELGTIDELRVLTSEAHELGMRTWLDFVPSHSSWHHPAFLAARADPSTPSHSWYTFEDWPETYRMFLQVSHALPSFNLDDPGAREHLIGAALYWLRNCKIDGYRIDHVIAGSMDFWTALLVATEAEKSDVVLVGEATDSPDSLRRYRGHMHGILDFPLARALRLAFATGTWSIGTLDAFLTAYETYMRAGPGRVSFLDNHDMDRFLWVAGNDVARLKMAAVCQFTLSATPVVYYGTEIGLTQILGAADAGSRGDEEARGNMLWHASEWNVDLHTFYRSLIRIRREEAVLHTGVRQTVHLNEDAGTYAYQVHPPSGDMDTGVLLVAFNTGNRESTIETSTGDVGVTCLLSTGPPPRIDVEQAIVRLTLVPRTAAIFRL